jgi:hypothetical protein
MWSGRLVAQLTAMLPFVVAIKKILVCCEFDHWQAV